MQALKENVKAKVEGKISEMDTKKKSKWLKEVTSIDDHGVSYRSLEEWRQLYEPSKKRKEDEEKKGDKPSKPKKKPRVMVKILGKLVMIGSF